MKITMSDRYKTPFIKLRIGQVFRWADNIYMKTPMMNDTKSKSRANCVGLSSGEYNYLDDTFGVTEMEAELFVTK